MIKITEVKGSHSIRAVVATENFLMMKVNPWQLLGNKPCKMQMFWTEKFGQIISDIFWKISSNFLFLQIIDQSFAWNGLWLHILQSVFTKYRQLFLIVQNFWILRKVWELDSAISKWKHFFAIKEESNVRVVLYKWKGHFQPYLLQK